MAYTKFLTQPYHFNLLTEFLKNIRMGVMIVTHDEKLINELGWEKILLKDGKIHSIDESC